MALTFLPESEKHMRNLMLALLVLFLTAPALRASEDLPVEYQSEIVPSAEVEPGAGADMHLTKINVEERAAPADAAAAQLGPRGSFWWVVGVIVVAGVILAVIL